VEVTRFHLVNLPYIAKVVVHYTFSRGYNWHDHVKGSVFDTNVQKHQMDYDIN